MVNTKFVNIHECRKWKHMLGFSTWYLTWTSLSFWTPWMMDCALWTSCWDAANSCRSATCVAARRWFSARSLWISLCWAWSFCSIIAAAGNPGKIGGGPAFCGRRCWPYIKVLGCIRAAAAAWLLSAARALSTPAAAMRLFDMICSSKVICKHLKHQVDYGTWPK